MKLPFFYLFLLSIFPPAVLASDLTITNCVIDDDDFNIAWDDASDQSNFDEAVRHCPNATFGERTKFILFTVVGEIHWGSRIITTWLCANEPLVNDQSRAKCFIFDSKQG